MSTSKKVATKKPTKKSPTVKKVEKKVEEIVKPKIGFKNYLYALLVLVGGILVLFYSFKWYQLKSEEKLMKSYLITSSTIVTSVTSLDEFDEISQELPSSYFIYLGYTGDKEVYNFEKELKVLIDTYNINDIFYYIDVTNLIKEDENYLDTIKKTLKLNNLDNVPAIIYVNNGEIKDSNILDGVKGTILKVEDLERLLNIYEFETVK